MRAAQSMLKFRYGIIFCGPAGRCSCCCLQPIPCYPRARQASIESHFTLPPIRITSDLKGPEAVVIDTNQFDFLSMPQKKEIVVAFSPTPTSDVADAARQLPPSLSGRSDASDGSPAISTRVRETLAQLGPVVSDHAGLSRKRVGLASESQRNFAQTRSEKRRRSARHRSFDTHQ